MFLAPAQWLVQLVAWLPDFLRPGIFVGVVLLILWFVFVQRGLPNLWHALCRGTARAVDALIGLVLLPDYLMTTARQRQEEGPGQATLMIGGVAERVLDGAGALYQRHLRDPIEWKPVPWLPLAAVVAILTAPWVVMKLTAPTSDVRRELAQGYEVWRDVESWADVDPSRRADPGVVWPPRPLVRSRRHHGRFVGVTLHCATHERCHGRLLLRAGSGRHLHSKLVSVRSGATKTVHMKLSHADADTHFLRVRVARAEPG
jgi:hypothetical protein